MSERTRRSRSFEQEVLIWRPPDMLRLRIMSDKTQIPWVVSRL